MPSALVIAAHPDDEILGCGGTIAHLADAGWSVHVLIMAEGITSRGASRDRAAKTPQLKKLQNAARAANKALGAASLTLIDFPDNRMDSVDLLDVVKCIEVEIKEIRPSLVLTHCRSDVNIDHRIVHDAVVTACRPLPKAQVHELLFFETPSSTEWRPPTSQVPFAPTVFYDISKQWKKKQAALKAYASEMRPFPHARSIKAVEALALWRGASCGLEAAEAFVAGRIVRP